MRRIVGLLALLSMLATPAVVRTRLFCKFTGVEITDCDEQRVPERPVVQQEDCCDRRLFSGGAPAVASREIVLVASVAISPVRPLVQPAPPGHRRAVPANLGPPLFIQQRALLI